MATDLPGIRFVLFSLRAIRVHSCRFVVELPLPGSLEIVRRHERTIRMAAIKVNFAGYPKGNTLQPQIEFNDPI